MSDLVDFKLAEQPTRTLLHVGTEQQPVIVFDSVMCDPAQLVDFAAQSVTFGKDGVDGGAYPGLGAPAPLDYARPLAQAVDPIIRQIFGIGDAPLTKARCRFSLVTTQPEDLSPLQRIPHIDTTDGRQFALLHYLCGDDFGGTAFFRHRATGYETIDAARAAHYRATRERELDDAPPIAAYFAKDSATYERIGAVESRFDRLVIYRSHLLHSGLINDPHSLSADPRRGRLTANIFLTYAAD
ncbi:DUF6445 family protein [Sphingomonas crusticola]|uniref:DUF6445 family protein n=1 Tax=Sphingomonas crusticola TaxID=1697973 RepID=UPI000E26EECA|nr:DUF6445 family protein [Sphingomonas crusticola]